MTKRYKNKQLRHQYWDYRWAGAYFITICTDNRNHYFGRIANGKMVLSNVGVIADLLWYEIKNHAKNMDLGAFVVMPNHIHGVLILNPVDPVVDAGHAVDSGHALNLRDNRFQNIGKNSVSSMIGGYKSAVTKHANRLGFEFGWQRRFHDHIIRNEQSFDRISNYIINNPANWNKDKFH